jgi:tetratricopeptide (TPR) repeat protein
MFSDGERDDLFESAAQLVEHSVARAEAGHRNEALISGQAAVDILRRLVALDRGRHPRNLAQALTNLAFWSAGDGRHTEALAATEEAVALRRELLEGDGDGEVPLAELVTSLRNLAEHVTAAGRPTEGISRCYEALTLTQRLVELNRDRHQAPARRHSLRAQHAVHRARPPRKGRGRGSDGRRALPGAGRTRPGPLPSRPRAGAA